MTVSELRKKLAELVDADPTVAAMTVVIDYNGMEDVVEVYTEEVAVVKKEKGTEKVQEIPVMRLVITA